MDKPFQTYAQLVGKLRDEKKLTVPDENRVIDLLKQHSYFSLVSGYKTPFKQSNGEYLPGTTIDDLLALFEFDNNLRDIFFHAIQTIEKHIKSLLSYAFVEKYGEDQKAYLTYQSYKYIGNSNQDTYTRCAEVKKLTEHLRNKVQTPFEQKYIEHQWNKHHNIPLWVVIKAVTLGTTSKMYSLCTQDVQANVSKEFIGVSEHQLIGMLDFLTRVRNVCAHNERLYDFDSGKSRAIQAMPVHKQLGIGKKKSYYKKGQVDLFAAVICFRYLLSDKAFRDTVARIENEIDDLLKRTKLIRKEQLLKQMGFPPNWIDILKYEPK